MIVLDASVLIAHLDAGDAHHQRATALLLRTAVDPIGVSPITLTEVLVGPARRGALDEATTALARMGLRTLPIPDSAPARLATLRATTGLKVPDCCVILAAETADRMLATFDDRLAEAARKLNITVYQTDSPMRP